MMVEYMEFLGASIAHAAAWSETVINVPTPRLGSSGGRYTGNRRTATAMCIHAVEYETTGHPDTTGDTWSIVLSKQSKTAEPRISDGDVIDKYAGAITTSLVEKNAETVVKHTFDKPVLIAGQKIFLGEVCDEAVGTTYVRIHYTMREVDEADLVRSQIV